MRDDRYYSSASMEDYIHWVMKDKLKLTDKELKRYRNLCIVSATIEFNWIHPMDENRATDGLELRDDFEYETGEYLDKSSGLPPNCSFFEMLAALSIRCENQLMRNLSLGDRTSKWFFEFLDNLGLDPELRTDDIEEIIINFMHGNYKSNGEGGMFPLKRRDINQRGEQLWKQMSAYISENYLDDGSDLLLFR